MPFGKDRGYVNQGGELLRINEENHKLRAALEEIWALHDTSGWTDGGKRLPQCDCDTCKVLRRVLNL